MNTKKLYIHIGTHKTGSTAIQHALNQCASPLQKEGIVYLQPPMAILKLMTSRNLDNEIINNCKQEIDLLIHNSGKNDSILLWSWEGFSGDPSIGYKNASVVAESLREITAGLDVYIIVYLRRQDDFIESLYTQRIHQGESYSFESFIKSCSSSDFNWERLLSSYSDFFGEERLIIRRYGKDFLPGENSLLNDFAQIINSDSLVNNIGANTPNRGYSRDALEIARLTNPYLNSDEKQELRKILQQTSSKLPFERYSFFTFSERQEIIAQYSKSNSNIARKYFNEHTGILFPCLDTPNGHSVYKGLTIETTVHILAKSLLSHKEKLPESRLLRITWKFEQKLRATFNKFPRIKSKLKYLVEKFK